MSRGKSVQLTKHEIRLLAWVAKTGGEPVDVGEMAVVLEIERAIAVRAAFGLRRKGFLKRDGWLMLPAVPMQIIEDVLIGDGYAASRC